MLFLNGSESQAHTHTRSLPIDVNKFHVMSNESRLAIDSYIHGDRILITILSHNAMINTTVLLSLLPLMLFRTLLQINADGIPIIAIILNTHNYRYNHDNCFHLDDCLSGDGFVCKRNRFALIVHCLALPIYSINREIVFGNNLSEFVKISKFLLEATVFLAIMKLQQRQCTEGLSR